MGDVNSAQADGQAICQVQDTGRQVPTHREEEEENEHEDTKETMSVISIGVDEGEEKEATSACPVVEAWTAPGKRGGKVASMTHLRLIGE